MAARTRVKICSITNVDDAMMAVNAGADALGFIFCTSKRTITPSLVRIIIGQLPSLVTTVGVFMNQTLDEVLDMTEKSGVDVVQLHGQEDPDYCRAIRKRVIKRIDIRPGTTAASLMKEMDRFQVSGFLLDPGAGQGRTFDWKIAAGIQRPCIVAGGLTPDNVGTVVAMLHPFGVDVSSGVEQFPGKKDAAKVKRFIQEVR